MPTRKVLFVKERVLSEAGSPAPRPVCRVAAIAVIDNPFAGGFHADLSPLFDIGAALGEELMPAAVEMLEAPPTSYGKSAIVGVNGDVEHAAAVLHSKLGKPMRAAVGGGEAIIPSTTKVGPRYPQRPGPRRPAPGRDRGGHGGRGRRTAAPADRQGPRGHVTPASQPS